MPCIYKHRGILDYGVAENQYTYLEYRVAMVSLIQDQTLNLKFWQNLLQELSRLEAFTNLETNTMYDYFSLTQHIFFLNRKMVKDVI